MKAAIPAFVSVIIFATACLADERPRTIVTRDHQVYEKAIIVDHNTTFVTISYDAGVVRVAVENLPADIQREFGYVSKIPDTPPPVRKVIAASPPQPTPAPAVTNPAASSAVSSPLAAAVSLPKETALATPSPASKPFTQAEANALYGTKQSAILKKWGKPLKIEKFTDLNKRQVTVLVYDEDATAGTKFWIYEKDGFVSGGVCNGRTIRNASKQAKLAKSEAATN